MTLAAWKRFLRVSGNNRQPAEHDIASLISRIDAARFARIRNQYAAADPYPGYSKYLDLELWMARAIERAKSLNIQGRKPSRILDIGAGSVYFPFVCAQSGHSVMALDRQEPRMYVDLADLLAVPRISHTIKALEPLPEMEGRFDLITAFSICFNGHNTPQLWDVDEWTFFLRDLATNFAHDETQIHLVFNQEPSGEFFSAALQKLFASYGGSCESDTVRLTAGFVRTASRLSGPT